MDQKTKDQLTEAARVFAESRMADNWDRKDHIHLGIFYKYFYEYILDNIPETDPWISVKDRLPEKGIRVLALEGTIAWEAYIRFDGKWKWYHVDGDLHPTDHITHWMPIPKPPKATE